MGTAFSYARRARTGLPGPTLHSTGTYPSALLLATLTGPATSVSDGMTIDLSDDLTELYHGSLCAASTTTPKYHAVLHVPVSNTSSTPKIRVWNLSTGALVAGGTDLSAETWYLSGIGG